MTESAKVNISNGGQAIRRGIYAKVHIIGVQIKYVF
jgi:hypothetical protein